MIRTGTQIVTAALRELGVLDPIEAANAEQADDALTAGSELLDSWRTDRLTIGGLTIASYSLALNTQSYTIGDGGTFDQVWPEEIVAWSVIPDDAAADPLELPMGRPLTFDQWQAIAIKSQTGPRPTSLYYDAAYSAGLGTCWFHPIPDNSAVDVKLYARIPVLTTLAAATQYDLRPGVARALILNLAIELADRYGKTVTDRLERRAAEALGALRRSNIRPVQAGMRSEYAIGTAMGRRTFNVYNGS